MGAAHRLEVFSGQSIMMRYRMVLIHDDESREEVAGGFDDLAEACREAFRIAEEQGRRVSLSGPRWVSIYRGDALELSVQIVGPSPTAADARRTG